MTLDPKDDEDDPETTTGGWCSRTIPALLVGENQVSYSSEVLADSPAIYYRLGEPSGTSAADSSGNGRNGTYTNTPTLGVTGIIGAAGDTAAGFTSGSSNYVAPSYTFNAAQATVEAWINIASAPAANQLIAGCINGLASSTTDKMLYVSSDEKLYFYAFDGAGKTTSAPASVIPTGDWVHVAGVADGSSLFTYVNGTQVGSVAAGNTYTGYTVSNAFVSGASAGGPSPSPTYFTGSIDEAAFYPSALSSTRITAHYTAGITPDTPQFIHPFNAIPFMSGH